MQLTCLLLGVDTNCSGHGVYQHNNCSCKCDVGWEGPDCSISTCSDNCNDNGYCVDGQCVCHTGYTGHDCGLLTCPDDCNDKGHCVDGKCVCFEGFSGDTCSMQKCPNDCKENGRCIDGQCLCDEGFFGNDCSMGKVSSGYPYWWWFQIPDHSYLRLLDMLLGVCISFRWKRLAGPLIWNCMHCIRQHAVPW